MINFVNLNAIDTLTMTQFNSQICDKLDAYDGKAKVVLTSEEAELAKKAAVVIANNTGREVKEILDWMNARCTVEQGLVGGIWGFVGSAFSFAVDSAISADKWLGRKIGPASIR